jgi:hypothetical protein
MSAFARILAAAALITAAACAFPACSGPRSAARVHPEELHESPTCSACHEKKEYPALDHLAGWSRTHAAPARQYARTCEVCHQTSFCADCHGRREEIKPSDKNADRPGVAMPHRGDYITRHEIDGRLDPASCFACHGRKNDWRCSQCHR